MQKNKSRSFWLLNLCYWAVYNLSQAFGSPTISAINLSQRFLLIGAFIFFMMFITGIYRFVYRRFQFDNQKTLFIIAQTLVGVLLIWGIDLLARYLFPSKTFDTPIPKFIAIAVWVGAYNFYKFRSRPQDKQIETLDNQNATTTNSFVQNSPIQEPIVEKTPIEIQTEIELNRLLDNAPDAPAKIEQTVEKEIEHLNVVSPIAPIEDVKIEQPAEIEVEHLNLVAQVAPIEDVKIVLPVEKEAEIIHILQQSSDLELRDLVNLEEEMADVEKYLSAEKIRLGDKLSYTFEIEEDALNQKIPPHIIEKLVKNAIQYGVEETANSGYVNIQSFVYDGFLTIEIRNSGQLKNETPFPKESGFPSSTVNEPSETRINIENTIKRLSEMFGENGFFNIENDGDSEVVATMCVPVAP